MELKHIGFLMMLIPCFVGLLCVTFQGIRDLGVKEMMLIYLGAAILFAYIFFSLWLMSQ